MSTRKIFNFFIALFAIGLFSGILFGGKLIIGYFTSQLLAKEGLVNAADASPSWAPYRYVVNGRDEIVFRLEIEGFAQYLELAHAQLPILDESMRARRTSIVSEIARTTSLSKENIERNYPLFIGAERFINREDDHKGWELLPRELYYDKLKGHETANPSDKIFHGLLDAPVLVEMEARNVKMLGELPGVSIDEIIEVRSGPSDRITEKMLPLNTKSAVTALLHSSVNQCVVPLIKEDQPPDEDKYNEPYKYDPQDKVIQAVDKLLARPIIVREAALAWLFMQEHRLHPERSFNDIPKIILLFINESLDARVLFMTKDIANLPKPKILR